MMGQQTHGWNTQGKFRLDFKVKGPPIATNVNMPVILEYPPTTDVRAVDDTSFLHILNAEGQSWPSVSIPKELSGASEAVVLFVSTGIAICQSPFYYIAHTAVGRCPYLPMSSTEADR